MSPLVSLLARSLPASQVRWPSPNTLLKTHVLTALHHSQVWPNPGNTKQMHRYLPVHKPNGSKPRISLRIHASRRLVTNMTGLKAAKQTIICDKCKYRIQTQTKKTGSKTWRFSNILILPVTHHQALQAKADWLSPFKNPEFITLV